MLGDRTYYLDAHLPAGYLSAYPQDLHGLATQALEGVHQTPGDQDAFVLAQVRDGGPAFAVEPATAFHHHEEAIIALVVVEHVLSTLGNQLSGGPQDVAPGQIYYLLGLPFRKLRFLVLEYHGFLVVVCHVTLLLTMGPALGYAPSPVWHRPSADPDARCCQFTPQAALCQRSEYLRNTPAPWHTTTALTKLLIQSAG